MRKDRKNKLTLFFIIIIFIGVNFSTNLNAKTISKNKFNNNSLTENNKFNGNSKNNCYKEKYNVLSKKFEDLQNSKKQHMAEIKHNNKFINKIVSFSSNTIYVPDDYLTIQSAVDNAFDGDTIIVRDGTYKENIEINKSIILKSETNYNNCIIEAFDNEKPCIKVLKPYVNISGFSTILSTTRNAWYGIGIQLYFNADHCNIFDNKIYNNAFGLITLSNYNNIYDNEISLNIEDGIIAWGENNTFSNNEISKQYDGILAYGDNDTFVENKIFENKYGVYYSEYTFSNKLIGNEIFDNYDNGIWLNGNNHFFYKNKISHNGYDSIAPNGVLVWWFCENIVFIENTITNNDGPGAYIARSKNITFRNNSFIDDGISICDYYHNTNTIIEKNTVNDKPLIYLEEKINYEVPPNAGQIILLNCDNVTIKNQEIFRAENGIYLIQSNNCLISDNCIGTMEDYGILTYGCSNNRIEKNNIRNCETAICVYGSRLSNNTIISQNYISKCSDGIAIYSNNNLVTKNTIEYSSHVGIDLSESFFNYIESNLISFSDKWGIEIWDACNNFINDNKIECCCEDGIWLTMESNDNTIANNNILNNFNGFDLSMGSNNIIMNNNFLDNIRGIQVDDYDYQTSYGNKFFNNNFCNVCNIIFYGNLPNEWNDESKGNYWNDYEGIDNDGDGVGDTEYKIANNNIDRYPLMEPNSQIFEDSPLKPIRPSGPTNGDTDESYLYTTSTTDPQGDKIFYLFFWDDGSYHEWFGPYESGEVVTVSHKWDKSGTYSVKVIAKDEYGHMSPRSDSLSVSMPRSKFTNFPFLQKILNFFLN